MLKSLTIKNFALIKEIYIEFDNRLNILTGETGAGKSVIVDAIMVLLGDRASIDYIRQGEKKAIIEGIFDISKIQTVKDILSENGYDDNQNEIILRREILEKGSSRCYVNDSPIAVSILKQIGDYLVDFHGQHDHQLLIRPETHIELLDIVTNFKNIKKDYSNKFSELKLIIQKFKNISENERTLKEKSDLYEYELEIIRKINPLPNEFENLENELKILQNAELIHRMTNDLDAILNNNENNTINNLIIAKKLVEQLTKIDNSFAPYLDEFNSVLITINEIVNYAKNYSDNIEFDEDKIEKIRQRLSKLNSLKKKYGSYNAIFERQNYLKKELSLISNFDEEINNLKHQILDLKSQLSTLASQLSDLRKKSSYDFSKTMREILLDLGMPNVEFWIQMNKEKIENPEITDLSVEIEGNYYKLFPNGYDIVEFLISTNKGEIPKPLALVASGGEISRVMLAIKSLVAEADSLPILIFDEIDTGISGRIAQKVGTAMKQLALKHQIIAITHLPQIAAKGDRNFSVKKIEVDNKTIISCSMLDPQEKIIEIAKLISGENITKSAIESAKELLK